MNVFKCLANDWADIIDLSSSGSEFHKQLPLNLIDLCPGKCMYVQDEDALWCVYCVYGSYNSESCLRSTPILPISRVVTVTCFRVNMNLYQWRSQKFSLGSWNVGLLLM